jgi:hypothetical protein
MGGALSCDYSRPFTNLPIHQRNLLTIFFVWRLLNFSVEFVIFLSYRSTNTPIHQYNLLNYVKINLPKLDSTSSRQHPTNMYFNHGVHAAVVEMKVAAAEAWQRWSLQSDMPTLYFVVFFIVKLKK